MEKINKSHRLYDDPFKYTIYHKCNNCGNQWNEQSEGYAADTDLTIKHDFCCECNIKLDFYD